MSKLISEPEIRSDEELTLETSVLKALEGGQFTLLTQLINQSELELKIKHTDIQKM